MHKNVSVPAFVFKPITTDHTTKETIKRQDDVLEIEFPVFEKEEVLKIAETLSFRKRRAHDRPIDEVIDIMDQVGALWMNPNYDIRKEVMEVITMTTGQSQSLCELELIQNVGIWNRKPLEAFLAEELGGKKYLDSWVPSGTMKLHAQPRGVVLHNIAGNAFNVGMLSLFFGLITKNVNLVKLPREEPYFTEKFAESIGEVDKKIAKEIAVLYWSGSKSEIYDELFNSGNIDCVLAWGGLTSIEDIRRRAYRFGIKVIDHGPKMSFSIISEEMLTDTELMQSVAQKLATDVAIWNQKACLSPRVVYIKEKSTQPLNSNGFKGISEKSTENDSILLRNTQSASTNDDKSDSLFSFGKTSTDITDLMQRSLKLLRNEITDSSPLGFAKILADSMKKIDVQYPRAYMTQADGMAMAKKREYFAMKYEIKDEAIILTPKKNPLNWTVVYLRNPPTLEEIDMCQDRFIVVTRIANIQDLVHFLRREKLLQYLQTFSIYGTDQFVEDVAEELSLLGAARFPRVGEHNLQKIGAPWDGHYVLNDMVRWVEIGFLTQEGTEEVDRKDMMMQFNREDPTQQMNGNMTQDF